VFGPTIYNITCRTKQPQEQQKERQQKQRHNNDKAMMKQAQYK
jgi:predicted sugar kinase